jgi:predicted NACHT family NTPase
MNAPENNLSSRQTIIPSGDNLKVFISSKMLELRDVREIVNKALKDRKIDAWIYEAHAGARPGTVEETSLIEVEASDIYVGLFWEKYGEVTVKEYERARDLGRPCFVYIRDRNAQREPALEEFLQDKVYNLKKGVTYGYFDSSLELGEQVAEDIMAWLVRRHREMTAEINTALVSQEETARLKAEVKRLQEISSNTLPQGTSMDYLAQQLKSWFETLGYRFERHIVRNEDYFEWIINIPARRGYDRVLVCGIEGEAEISDVISLRRAVNEHRLDEGWVVSTRGRSPAANLEVEKEENRDLFCYTFDELIEEHADFSVYLEWLEAEVKRRGIDKMYVPLACTKDEFDITTKQKVGQSHYDESNGWIDGYIDRWLDDPVKEHISILGEFGTGKTWFALHYAWKLLKHYRDAKKRGIPRPRLPLVIPLRDYAKAVTVESLFSEFFFRRYEIPIPGYSAFEQLNRMGKLLLIFDGFDEMADKIDRQKMIDNFWTLAQVVVPGSKIILTCRTEHFPEATEGRALLRAELKASTSALTGVPPQFEVLELQKLEDAQIRQVLSYRTNSATADYIMNNSELLDLARRPIMTELILEALPDIEDGKEVDLSRTYLYAIRRKMERDIKAERTFTSLADKLYFLCELSWEMLSSDKMSLNYRDFPDRIRRLFTPIVQEQKDLDHWHFDMMGQTLLIRNADGDYTPAHKSFLEFFVAYKFAAELGVLAPDFSELAQKQSNVDVSKLPQDYTWSSYFQRTLDDSGNVIPIAPLRDFIPETIDTLVKTIGQRPFAQAILTLLQNMLNSSGEITKTRLLSTILATKDKSIEEIKATGGNTASLIVAYDSTSLMNSNLMGTNLSNANFRQMFYLKADFSGTNFEGAYLQDVKFYSNPFLKANLSHAQLHNSKGLLKEDNFYEKVAIDPQNSFIVGGGITGEAKLWDIKTLEEKDIIHNMSWISCIAVSMDRRLVAVGDNSGHISIYDLKDNVIILKIHDHDDAVADLEFTSENNLIAASGGNPPKDDSLRLYELPTGKLLWHYKHNHSFRHISYNPLINRLVALDWSGGVDLWDIKSRKHIGNLLPKNEDYYSWEFATDLECKVIIIMEKVIRHKGNNDNSLFKIISVDDNKVIWSKGSLPDDLLPSESTNEDDWRYFADSVAVMNRDDSYIIAFNIKNRFVVWDASNDKEILRSDMHIDSIENIYFFPNKRQVVTASRDCTIRIWDINERALSRTIVTSKNYRGLHIKGVKGLTLNEVEALKERGAIEE